ncbi:MAG: SDR family NAD(P)-dependent oxidoreductase [Nevskia sp.]|nr:SDR family NAD(P)-dependent oxidoreductase [Nevskia sp.]
MPAGYAAAAGLLRERVILVTGAGDGLGRAAALGCAAHGATVVLLGRTVKKLEQVYDAIEALEGAPKPAIYPMNLAGATWAEHEELAATVERELGRLDGIVHCAAHFRAFMPLADETPRDWVEGLQVNLTAAYTLTRVCLPLLRRAPDASVVFLSDAAGRQAKAYRGAFGVAKYAIEGLARSWALELESTQPNIRINTYDPGPLRTALRLRGYPGEEIASAPLPETAVPDLLYLLGPDSRGISGAALARNSDP